MDNNYFNNDFGNESEESIHPIVTEPAPIVDHTPEYIQVDPFIEQDLGSTTDLSLGGSSEPMPESTPETNMSSGIYFGGHCDCAGTCTGNCHGVCSNSCVNSCNGRYAS